MQSSEHDHHGDFVVSIDAGGEPALCSGATAATLKASLCRRQRFLLTWRKISARLSGRKANGHGFRRSLAATAQRYDQETACKDSLHLA
ncbi:MULTISPECIES: hypothetical protein [unclassified Pseudoxanthomonas]|uniref:hypothetical protein n=1 Tax=unclassified Pseudoxanthomonas TaxID=2645906 RepID=UPI00307EB113